MADDKKSPTSSALASAKASLATARISLSELDKLRAETRGPLPTLHALGAILGQNIDDDAVMALTATFGLRRRTLASGGFDAAGRSVGVRMTLDDDKKIQSITLFGDDDAQSFSTWHGPLDHGLNMTSKAADVRRERGRPAVIEDVGGETEERYLEDGVVYAFVYAGTAISQVRIRRTQP